MITDKVQVVKITVCECDPFDAVYTEDGLCLNCKKPRPNDIKVYDCPAGCEHGRRGGRECAYCDGRGYIS